MEVSISFVLTIFELSTFWYYLSTFRKRKNFPLIFLLLLIIFSAAIMVWINGLNLPFFNLIALITILVYISLLFDGNIRSRTITVITFMGMGILVEPLGAIMIYILSSSGSKSYNYYFIEALCSFIRVNMVFFICKLHSMKSIRIAKLPLEICGVVITIFSLAVINCCFTVFFALKSGNLISVIICIGIVLSVMLSYYLIYDRKI